MSSTAKNEAARPGEGAPAKDKVIRIVSRVDGYPTRIDGRYVVAYDPARPGNGTSKEPVSGCHLVLTDAIAEAAKFTAEEAMELWRRQYGVRDWDGGPNRPLCAYHVEIVPADGSGPMFSDLLRTRRRRPETCSDYEPEDE